MALDFPLQFRRQYSGPLDEDSVFETTADRNAYLSNARRYKGQPVVDLEAGKMFIINAAKDAYIPVGGNTIHDVEVLTYTAMSTYDKTGLQDGAKFFVWDASGDVVNTVTGWAYYRWNKEDDKFTLLSKSNTTTPDLTNYYTKAEVNSAIAAASGGGAGSFGIFITDITVAAGQVLTKGTASGTIGQTVINTIFTDTRNVTVTVEFDGPADTWNGTLKIAGNLVPVGNITRIGETRRFRAVQAITIPVSNRIEALHVETNKGAAVIVTMAAAAPELTDLTFGPLPGAQTELKQGDVIAVTVTLDKDAAGVEIADFEALMPMTHNATITAGTPYTFNATVANRGTSLQSLRGRIRAKNAVGSWGTYFTSMATVPCNNLYPSFAFGAVSYPASQQALKGSESATATFTASNYDSIVPSSPNAELGSLTVNASDISVSRIAGSYNVSTNNLRAVVTRNANGSSITVNGLVQISNAAPVISLSVPATRLRSGGSNGSPAQSHIVTLSSDQRLIAAPVITASKGSLVSTMAGGPTTYTQSLTVTDTDTKGAGTFGLTSATNLAGVVASGINSGAGYTLGGYVSRTITGVPAFNSLIAVGTEIVTATKVSAQFFSNVLTYEAGSTPSAMDKFCVVAPDKIKLHADQANLNASGTGTLTTEELV